MKKLLALLLAAACVVCLSACGASDPVTNVYPKDPSLPSLFPGVTTPADPDETETETPNEPEGHGDTSPDDPGDPDEDPDPVDPTDPDDSGDDSGDPDDPGDDPAPHIHSASGWSFDNSVHYKQCDCGVRFDEAPHEAELTSTEASHCYRCACGYTYGEEAHEVQNGELHSDGTWHWYQCKTCGKVYGKTAHRGDITHDEHGHRYLCSTCGATYGESEHTGTLFHNETKHWYRCECGYIYGEVTHEAHEGELVIGETEHWYRCSVCEEEYGNEAHMGGLCHGKTGHWYSCSTCGKAYGEEGHEGKLVQGDETSHWRVCSTCNEIYDEEPHSGELLSDETGHRYRCSACGATYGKHGHTFENGACSVCDYPEPSAPCPLEFGDVGDGYAVIGYTTLTPDLVIPDEYEGAPVVEIGAYAFENAETLLSVTLGKNVKRIMDGAFSGCIALETVVLPESLEQVGAGAFEDVPAVEEVNGFFYLGYILLDGDGIGLTARAGTTIVADSAFDGNGGIKSVILPASMKIIGTGAFAGCTSLATLDLGGTEIIHGEAFAGCMALTTVTIPATVRFIDNAFGGCQLLTDVIFSEPNGWTEDGMPLELSDSRAAAKKLKAATSPWERA